MDTSEATRHKRKKAQLKTLLAAYKEDMDEKPDFSNSALEKELFAYFNSFAAANDEIFLQTKSRGKDFDRGNVAYYRNQYHGEFDTVEPYTVRTRKLADWAVPMLKAWRRKYGYDEMTGQKLENKL